MCPGAGITPLGTRERGGMCNITLALPLFQDLPQLVVGLCAVASWEALALAMIKSTRSDAELDRERLGSGSRTYRHRPGWTCELQFSANPAVCEPLLGRGRVELHRRRLRRSSALKPSETYIVAHERSLLYWPGKLTCTRFRRNLRGNHRSRQPKSSAFSKHGVHQSADPAYLRRPERWVTCLLYDPRSRPAPRRRSALRAVARKSAGLGPGHLPCRDTLRPRVFARSSRGSLGRNANTLPIGGCWHTSAELKPFHYLLHAAHALPDCASGLAATPPVHRTGSRCRTAPPLHAHCSE